MMRYLFVAFSMFCSLTAWVAALADDQASATNTQQFSPSKAIGVDDFESEYIDDFELADTPSASERKYNISGFMEKEYSRGRMAFLFGQYESAYEIWKPLAEHGYAKAQATLGWMYHTGKGVKKDMATAFEWYEKAAKQNHPVAQNNLGVFFEQGLSVGRSASNAAKWYREAAEWGYPFAQYNLGTLYLEGRGVKKDEKEAQFWLQIAALQGVEQAIEVLQKMSIAVHNPVSGNTAPKSSGGPQWSRNNSTDGQLKSPHNTPHGSNRYKDIYNRIKSPGSSDLQGFNYGSHTSASKPSSIGTSSSKTTIAQANPSSSRTTSNDTPDTKANKKLASVSSEKNSIEENVTSPEQASKPQDPTNHSTADKSQTPANVNESPVKPATDELLPGEKFDKWLAEAQVAQKRLKELEKDKRTNSHILQIYNDEWVKEQKPSNFTLQLARSDELNWLLDIAKKQPMLKDTAYYTELVDGKKWYYLIYGNFNDFDSATAEIDKLPKALKKWSPWVRKFSDVQSKIQAE